MLTLAPRRPEVKSAEHRSAGSPRSCLRRRANDAGSATTVPNQGGTHMAVTTAMSADATAIRPFTIDVPESDLEDLRARIAATRWPEKEGVEDASQGVQLATIQAVARYWETEYDWRKCEAKLNSVHNSTTEIDGLDIHFVHVRSKLGP